MSGKIHVPICHDCGAVDEALLRVGRRKFCAACARASRPGPSGQGGQPDGNKYAANLRCKGCRRPFDSFDRRSNRYCARCRSRLADGADPEIPTAPAKKWVASGEGPDV